MRIAGRSGLITTSLMMGFGNYLIIKIFYEPFFSIVSGRVFTGSAGHELRFGILSFCISVVPITMFYLLVRRLADLNDERTLKAFRFFSYLMYFFPFLCLLVVLHGFLLIFSLPYSVQIKFFASLFRIDTCLGAGVFFVWLGELFWRNKKDFNNEKEG